MPYINQLPLLSQVSAGDQIPVYTPNNGDARRLPISQLLTYFQTTFASPSVATNLYTPGTGFNITVPTPVSEQQWILFQPAGTLAAGTLTFPLNTLTPDGTEILITSTQTITSFTININNAAAIFGAVSMLQAGTAIRYRYYQATNSWYNITSDEFAVLGSAIQTFLITPNSANLAAAVTDETGSGSLVFANTPTLVTPILGTPTSGTLTNCNGLPVANTTGTLAVNRGGSGAVSLNGVLKGNGTSAFTAGNIDLATEVTGTLPVLNGGTGTTAATGTGSVVLANTPTLITPNIGAATATSVATGPVFGTVQSLSGPGAVNITSLTTAFTSSGTGDALTLADGAAGQFKNIVYVAQVAGADTGILTPANFGNGTTITFNNVGDSCQLQYIGTNWWIVSLNDAVVA